MFSASVLAQLPLHEAHLERSLPEVHLSVWWIMPFIVFLLMIATGPALLSSLLAQVLSAYLYRHGRKRRRVLLVFLEACTTCRTRCC